MGLNEPIEPTITRILSMLLALGWLSSEMILSTQNYSSTSRSWKTLFLFTRTHTIQLALWHGPQTKYPLVRSTGNPRIVRFQIVLSFS